MYLKPKHDDYYILDLEADSLTPSTIWCVCVESLSTDKTWTFFNKEIFKAWHKDSNIYIGHNAISFDIPVLNRLWDMEINLDNICDSLVLSYLYNPALENGHSLEAWGERLKFPKGDYSDWSRLTEEMVSYCRTDTSLTKKVYKALISKMNKLGYSELSARIEHKIRIVIDEQERNGFWFDKVGADDFRLYLRNEQARLSKEIEHLFPPRRTKVAKYTFRTRKDGSPSASYEAHRLKYSDIVHVQCDDGSSIYECYEFIPFNLGSPKQRVERLLELGWEPKKFTPKGFPKVDEDSLVAYAEECKKSEIKALAEWLVIQGRASMLDTWFANLGEDSRIHGKIFTCGATTRRMTHNSPNTANIPSGAKAKYGHECRSFWGVEPGRGLVLVGYDAAGLETAGLCHYLNNERATEALLRDKPNDIHTANSKRLTEALGWPVDREWGAKTSWYAWLYGAYPKKLGSIVGASKHGMSEEAAGEIVIDTFFRNVPGLKRLIDDIQHEWKTSSGRLVCVDHGFVICPNINASLNYRVQSLGTILIKLSQILLREEAARVKLPFKLVASIHDESQLEVYKDIAEEVGKLAVWSIEEAGRQLKLNVPVTGDFKIGPNWAATH